MADLSAYADALGVAAPARPRVSGNPPPGSGLVPASEQRPDSTFPDGSASGPGGSVADLKKALADPRVPPEAKADLTKLLGQYNQRAQPANSPYAEALGVTAPVQPVAPVQAQQAPQQRPQAQQYSDIPVPLDQKGPQNEPKQPSWWEKANAAVDAGLSTISGATTGMVGGLLAGANNVAGLPVALARGDDLSKRESLESAFQRGQQAGTYTPGSELGKQYAEDIANSKVMQSLPAVAPALGAGMGTAPGAGRFVGDTAKTATNALQDAFAAKQAAAPRIEPTMAKPRYQLVDGKPQLVGEQPAAAATPAATATAKPIAPTLAQASPELQQAVANAKAKGVALNPVAVSRHVEAETLPVPGKLTEGQALKDPSLISDEMNGRGKAQPPVSPDFYKQQGQVVAKNMEAIRASAAPDIPPTASHIDHGQSMLDFYKQMDEPVVAAIRDNYKALADANGGSMPVNGKDFVAAADAALAKQMKGRYVPKEVAGDMAEFRDGGAMSYEQFENLRTNLAAESRKAQRSGDGNAAHAVSIVRNALEQLPMEGETALVKAKADIARNSAKARFDALEADPAYKAAVNDSAGIGEASPLADRFFNTYVTNGKRANLAKMQEHLADNPLAKQTIAAGTIDQLTAQMNANAESGNFRSAAYQKAIKNVDPKLGYYVDPKTAQTLKAVGNFAENAQVQPRGSYVNNSNTLVGHLAEKAKSGLEHGANMAAGGIPFGTVTRSVVGGVLSGREARNAAKKATEPGAGITKLSDFPK